MTTLTVSATHDYSAENVSGTDVITFTNAAFTAVSATFLNTQFGSQIDSAVHINNSVGGNVIAVSGGSISALNWTFSDWINGDVVRLNGGTAADVIFGSIKGDFITGGADADVLFGAQGDDTIALDDGDFVAGEMIDGSVGLFDTLLLRNATSSVNLTAANAVSNIERLAFGTSGGSAKMLASSFGTAADKINTISGNSGRDAIGVGGSTIDFSTISIFDWSDDDLFVYTATSGNDSIRATAFADAIALLDGEDSAKGGSGNDTISATISAGDKLEGGGGSGDMLDIGVGPVDLRTAALLTGFEIVRFSGIGGAQLTASGTQIRGGSIAKLDGNDNVGISLIVTGDDVDLSALTFVDWDFSSNNIMLMAATASSKLIGSSKADSIIGLGGNDVLTGRGGKDTLNGGGGTDRADYSDKTKKVEVKLEGGTAVNVKVDGTVQDSIIFIEGVIGGSAGDKLTGDSLGNTFRGKGGVDTIDGAGGSDTADYSDKTKTVQVTLNGSSFATVKVNGNDEDKIKNIEHLVGGAAGDKLTGDSKNNAFAGKRGNDTLDGAGGSDTANYSDKSKKVEVTLKGSTATTVKVDGNNEDSIKNVENVTGGSAGDKFTGDDARNTFRGGGGKDTLNGAGGSDTADYSDKGHQVEVALDGSTSVTVKVGGTVEDSIKNIENVTGGNSNDKLTGDGKANKLSGNGGDDIIKGSGGNDTLVGGAGEDSLTGGSGDDTFLFNVSLRTSNIDKIADFKHADDTIQLDNNIMPALNTGSLAANRFLATAGSAEATAATQRIIYEKTNGIIYYDADGDVGGQDPVVSAILTNVPANIDHTDFKIV